MANTFRATRYFRATQSFTATSPHADNLFVADQATDCPNAATLGETKSWLDRCACDPARVAQGERRHVSSFALDHQARVSHARLDSQTQPANTEYFPKPLQVVSGSLHALDWTCRYLEEGPKIYAFHTLNMRTRAWTQTIATDKSYETVWAHSLHTWKTLGIPQFLQLDNDAAFCGGYKAPRIFGQFVRLCLSLGIELIFLPIAQPEHNGEVEELNGLWGHAFRERRHFTSCAQVCRTSPAFVS
jgi:hypothetical protein